MLLALGEGTGHADGQWTLPSDELEHGEHTANVLIRQAREQIALRIGPDEPRLVTTVHQRNHAGFTQIGLVFAIAYQRDRHGELVNAEPHRCAKVAWFPLGGLPANTNPYTAACVEAFCHCETFAVSGWW